MRRRAGLVPLDVQGAEQPIAIAFFESVLPQHFPCGYRQRCQYPCRRAQLTLGDTGELPEPDEVVGAVTRRGCRRLWGGWVEGPVLLIAAEQCALVGQSNGEIRHEVDPGVGAAAPLDVPPRPAGRQVRCACR